MRHNNNRFVCKITVAKRLLKGATPVLDFPLEGEEPASIQFLRKRECSKLFGL